MTGQQPHAGQTRPQAHANVLAGRFAPSEQHPLKRKRLEDWTLVKRARFNAAKRLERKQSAGIVTLAVVALYGGLISVFNLMFKHRVGADVRDVLEYVAVVSSWMTLIIGLTEQMKSHGANARELHDCAREVNDLQKELAATPVHDERALAPFLQRYARLIEKCRPNHDDVDYTLAERSISRGERERLAASGQWDERRHGWQLWRARMTYHWATYWFYVVISLVPPVVGVMLWWLVPGAPAAAAAPGS